MNVAAAASAVALGENGGINTRDKTAGLGMLGLLASGALTVGKHEHEAWRVTWEGMDEEALLNRGT